MSNEPSIEVGSRSAAEAFTCPVCSKVSPPIRTGAIECHHDGSYTTMAPLSVQAELEAWRDLGRNVLGAFASRNQSVSNGADGFQINGLNITAEMKSILGVE